jgi:hypothetical protein
MQPLKKSKRFWQASTRRLGAFTQSAAVILWRKLPCGFKESLVNSTPFYIDVKNTTQHILVEDVIYPDGATKRLTHSHTDGLIVYSCGDWVEHTEVALILSHGEHPDTPFREWKLEPAKRILTELKDVCYAG